MTPTPKDLDPKFKNAEPPTEDSSEEKQEAVSQIVFRQPIINPDGTPGMKEHGPMPVTEWLAYSEKNGL